MRSSTGIVVLSFALGACASNYEVSPEVRKAEWEARNIYPKDYRPEIVAYLRTYLNDPSNVKDAAISEPVLKPMGLGNRYVSCVRYVAKQDSGMYAPSKEHLVIFVDGKLDAFQDTKEQCANASYGPFPELEKLKR